jgi:transcriptional regulator with XRE-family HTH domain
MPTDASGIVLPSRDMTTDEFRQWFARLGLNQSQLARRLDASQPQVSRWLSGENKPPGHLWLALERLEQILAVERAPKKRRRQREAGDQEGTSDG